MSWRTQRISDAIGYLLDTYGRVSLRVSWDRFGDRERRAFRASHGTLDVDFDADADGFDWAPGSHIVGPVAVPGLAAPLVVRVELDEVLAVRLWADGSPLGEGTP
jgi:hypothetical protein